MIYPNITTKS